MTAPYQDQGFEGIALKSRKLFGQKAESTKTITTLYTKSQRKMTDKYNTGPPSESKITEKDPQAKAAKLSNPITKSKLQLSRKSQSVEPQMVKI